MNPTLSSYVAGAIAAERLHAADRRRLVRLAAQSARGQGTPEPAGSTAPRPRLRWRRTQPAQ